MIKNLVKYIKITLKTTDNYVISIRNWILSIKKINKIIRCKYSNKNNNKVN